MTGRPGAVLVGVPGPAPTRSMPVAPEHISASQRVVAGPQDVPATGDAAVDASMTRLRELLTAPGRTDEVGVLAGICEALTRRLADAAG